MSAAPARQLLPADLEAGILRLKEERNAVLLAHYYQESEIQDLADVVGDSLQLARAAQKVDRDVIAFCGVHFMAETAKILNPGKTVVVPDLAAGCSLADGCPADAFEEFKARHPGAVVVSYVNCSAAVKALSDVIVTSSSAEAIINQLPADQKILFAPDRHLGAYLARKTGREMELWPGTCVVHEQFSEKALVELKIDHPDAVVLAHPECPEAILARADHVGSTSSILREVQHNPALTFLIATEPGIIHQMEKLAPGKTFIGVPGGSGECACNTCPYMKRNTLEKLHACLRDGRPELQLDEALRVAAERPLRRMLEMTMPSPHPPTGD